MGRKSFKSSVYEATESFSRRLADRDPELMRELAEMRGEKLLPVVSHELVSDSTAKVDMILV